MDMMPPQAPPAIVRGADQEAIDTLDRLVGAHAWVTDQQALLSQIALVDPEAGDSGVSSALDAFWQAPAGIAPGAPSMPRVQAMASVLASAMRDEATLRHLDGALDERALRLVRAVTSTGASALPSHLHARELLFGDVAYAGALVIEDDRESDMSLLFTPIGGWETFDSREALHRATEHRVRDALAAGSELPGIMADDLEWVVDRAFVGSRDIHGDTFATLVARVASVQREQAVSALAGLDAAPGIAAKHAAFADRLAARVNLHDALDIESMLASRNRRLVVAVNEGRLARASAATSAAWRRSATGYATTLATVERERVDAGLPELVPLDVFADEALGRALAARGVVEAPSDITIDVYPMPALDTPGAVYDAWVNGVEPPDTGLIETVPLAELALRNVGFLERNTFRARARNGRNLAPLLDHGAIKALVRDSDIAATYRDYMTRELMTSKEAELRRALSMKVERARMRFDANDAALFYEVPGEPPSFADDHAKRGYEWVSAVLDAPTPSSRRRVEGHAIVARQMTYKGIPVNDVLAFGVQSSGGVFTVVYYTPGAPDGRTFREYADRQAAARDFLYNPAFETYLLDRLPVGFAVSADGGATRHFHVDPAHANAGWVFGVPGDSRYVRTDEPFDERAIEGNVFDALYDARFTRLSLDLTAAARSTYHADLDHLAPPIGAEALARRVSAFIGRPFAATWRAYDEARAGNYGEAFVQATDAYTASLDYLAIGAAKVLGGRGLALRGGLGAHRLEASGKRLATVGRGFEKRYVAKGVVPAKARGVKDGVHAIDGKSYIRHDGKMYRVRFDREADSWRLMPPDAVATAPWGPAIVRDAQGHWDFNRTGLLGGSGRPLLPSIADMTPWQRIVARQELRVRLGDEGAERVSRLVFRAEEAGTTSSRLTAAELTHWRDAMASGRRAPALRPGSAGERTVQAGAVDLTWQPHRRLDELLPADWPANLYYYPKTTEHVAVGYGEAMLPVSLSPATGASGFNAVSVAPAEVRASSLPVPNLHLGMPRRWVRLDLHALRNRVDEHGNLAFGVFRVRDGSNFRYLVRPKGALAERPEIVLRGNEFEFAGSGANASLGDPGGWWRRSYWRNADP